MASQLEQADSLLGVSQVQYPDWELLHLQMVLYKGGLCMHLKNATDQFKVEQGLYSLRSYSSRYLPG